MMMLIVVMLMLELMPLFLPLTAQPYLKFVTSTTSGAGVKIFRPVSKKCELVCFSVKIINFVFFGVKKSGIGVFLVSVENGAGVKKMTNFRYENDHQG